MKKSILVGAVFALFAVTSCVTNPITGKKTLAMVDNSTLFPMAFEQYSAFLNENKVVSGTEQANLVNRVGNNIRAAAEKWLASLGQSSYLDNYRWEYKLVEDNALNAWCMPGGKIVVYTGILPYTKTESGLATVMGHEVAHALLNHGQQRTSASIFQQYGAAGLDILTSGKSEAGRQAWMTAYGAGSQIFGMLPFSRSHESEADKIGLVLMTIAGYNPEEAIPFWERMSQGSGGGAPSEYFSTHPSHETRISNLTKWIPEAKTQASQIGVIKK